MEEGKTEREDSSSSSSFVLLLEENKPPSTSPSQDSMGRATFPNKKEDENNPSTTPLRWDSSSSKSSKRTSSSHLPAGHQDGQEDQGETDRFPPGSLLPGASSCNEDTSFIGKQNEPKCPSLSSQRLSSPKASPGRLSLGLPPQSSLLI
ncbi:hypothetical protein CSUI_009826 [Cystoisospora suis]|uniref:Uncharacterized protein n=1 Tax=Cystoisospora suis TaxID=483139 RepID=A0A2C6KI82_9APIC|nr:hypothetical protein CSUI_009826 [Cystoisospora suis]